MASTRPDPIAPWLAAWPLAQQCALTPLDDGDAGALRQLEQRLAAVHTTWAQRDADPETWTAMVGLLLETLERVGPLLAAPATRAEPDAPPPASVAQQQRALAILWLEWCTRRITTWVAPEAPGEEREDQRGEVTDLVVGLHQIRQWPQTLLGPHFLVGVLKELPAGTRRAIVEAHWPSQPDQPLVAPPGGAEGPMWALRTRLLFRDLPARPDLRPLLGIDDQTPAREMLSGWLSHPHRDIRVLGLRMLGELSPTAADDAPPARRPTR